MHVPTLPSHLYGVFTRQSRLSQKRDSLSFLSLRWACLLVCSWEGLANTPQAGSWETKPEEISPDRAVSQDTVSSEKVSITTKPRMKFQDQ